nr:PREDICTED: cilia- and flagella-associated protein 70-like isoform X2 [Megachile rotundata]
MEARHSILRKKNIEITINTIQNVIKKEDISLSFIVEHDGNILGTSDPIIVASDCEDMVYKIEFTATLSVSLNTKQSLSTIVSTPVLIKAMQTVENGLDERASISDTGTKKKSVFTFKSSSHSILTMLGICNLDLLPTILGEKGYTEKLILETPKFSMDGTLVSWQNLPLVTVTVYQDNVSFFESYDTMNFLNITIESIHNLPQTFTENMQYKAGTIQYIDDEVPENIIFENGAWTKYRDVERTKRWNTLQFLENRAQLSKYKLDCDFMGVRNPFKEWFNLTDKVCEDVPRIEWNSLNRSLIWTSGIEAMKNHIIKYRYWPFQILVTGRGVPSKSSTALYQCAIDVSELLFPGRKRCRVRNGAESRKTKTKRAERQRLSEMVTKPDKMPSYIYTSDLAEKQFMTCIQKLSEHITECYRDFCEENQRTEERTEEEKYCFNPNADEIECFTQYLYKTGEYLAIRNTLRSKVPLLLDQKFNMPANLVDSNEAQNFIASIYTYLAEQTRIALNKIVENRFTQQTSHLVNSKLIYFYAEEAYELGKLDIAREYYTTIIESNKANPDSWTKYAIFLKKIGDVERAKECCLEAISLDKHHAIALLMYALILFENNEYREAEVFLKAVTNFYPRFFECWGILHIFYIRTEYYPGIDLTLRIAEKCMTDKNREVVLDQEPLSWTMIHCPPDNIYLLVATFLLKLHFCEFAGIALAQTMLDCEASTDTLYYLAVEHYLSGRYEDTLSHLKQIECSFGVDFSVSSLMGHCYLKMGDEEKAVEYYDFACMLFDRPEMAHLVEIRLGYHHYNVDKFDSAKKMFLNACKASPTSHTWLGVGMCCYEFKEAEMALTEANLIDNSNPDTWGYLCLLNMTLERYDEFVQCYAEMIKNNLKNKKLWLRITNMMEALDYTPPDLVTGTNDFNDSQSKEEFEEQFEQ